VQATRLAESFELLTGSVALIPVQSHVRSGYFLANRLKETQVGKC